MYDVIIIGGGPAGFSGALYCARANLNTLLIERQAPGGQMSTTEVLENYPGLAEPISGTEIAFAMEKQAKKFGANIINDDVIEVQIDGKIKIIKTAKEVYQSKAIILAMGAIPKMIGLKKEKEFMGLGVSYCAICDGSFYYDQSVAIIGGGDTALVDAIYLSRICKKIYIIHRRDELRGSKYLQKKIEKEDKIEIIWDTVIDEILGESQLEGIKVKNVKTNETKDIKIEGIFVAIGAKANTELVKDKVALNKDGYIISDYDMNTNVPGVFVAGDIREKTLRQVITAAADGAIAAHVAEQYIIKENI